MLPNKQTPLGVGIEEVMAGDAKEVDHRIRLNREELVIIRVALRHMLKDHRREDIADTEKQWDYHVEKLIARLHPERLGRGRRW